MRRREKILISFVVVIITAGSISIWLTITKKERLPDTIRIASGPKGGEYYKLGEILEKKLSLKTKKKVKNIENRETDGTLENLKLLKKGEVEVALLQSIVFPDPNDELSNNVTVIAPLFLEPAVILAKKESGIDSIYDLEDRRVCTGPEESGIIITSDDLLEFYGLNVKKVHAFFDIGRSPHDKNNCDAGIAVMGLRGPSLRKMGETGAVKFLELPYTQALAKSKAFLAEFTLPAGVFARHPSPPLPCKDIQTVAYTALLAVRQNASSALVNNILDSIYSTNIQINFPDLLPLKEVREWSVLPLNQIAQEYYNPLRRMEAFANRMESCAAIKELFFAFLAISYFIWLRFHELRKRRERILNREIKEKVDGFLQETIALDKKQMESDSPEELQSIIARITELKIHVLRDLTDEKLRADQMVMIFLTQCHNIIDKIQTKLLILQQIHKTETS
ncbi:TAXI family TRAP transporter solute-binding subunit [Candidatus Electrothrix sp.]|uniref:TAXI family TRAP transporter solute-binding subunit n=1 Tax=Candidatus Electrothrix sp. TaxID=2170559 RepID=UPI004055AA3E